MRFLFQLGTLCCVCVSFTEAQPDDVVMPSWLHPYPGAVEKRLTSKSMTESTYSVSASLDAVSLHFEKLFSEAGLTYSPNSDGIGLTIRAAATECDLLVKIRSNMPETTVRVSCAAKSAGGLAGAPVIENRTNLSRRGPKSMDVAQGELKERSARFLVEADERARKREDSMAKYDTPVKTYEKGGFYNDDAPPLVWPVWFIQKGTSQRLHPVKGKDHGDHLESRYQTTNVPMSALYRFYQDLFQANGFKLGPTRLETGQTLDGKIMQNHNGAVEAHYSAAGPSGASTRLKASFRRSMVNGPIYVTLHVEVKGSFGSRH